MHFRGSLVLYAALRCAVITLVVGVLAVGCSSDPGPPPAPVPLLNVAVRVPDCQSGRVLAPGAQTTLRVTVTDAATGAPSKDVAVRFVAPDSGASGTFVGGDPATPTYARAITDESGVAAVDLATNATPGFYLVDVLVENAEAQASFAVTNTPDPIPAVTADQARCRLEQDAAYDPNAADRMIHGPLLLSAGTTIGSGEPGGATEPIFTAPGPTWFFWVDDHRSAAFAHPSRFVTVDTNQAGSSPVVFPSEWWPVMTLPGAAPTALLSPWRTNVQPSAASLAPSRPAPASFGAGSTRSASSPWTDGAAPWTDGTGVRPLADPPGTKSCVIIIHGLPEDAFRNTAKDVRDHVKRRLGITNVYMNPDDANGNPTPPTKADLGRFIDQAVADGCTKIYFFSLSHGYRGGAGGFSDGAGNLVRISYDEMAQMFRDRIGGKNITLHVVLFACYSGSALRAFDGVGLSGEIVTSSDENNLSYMTPGWFRQTMWFTDGLMYYWGGRPQLNTDSLEVAFREYMRHGLYPYNLSQNPQYLPLSAQPDAMQVPAVEIPCPGDVVAVEVATPAADPNAPAPVENEAGTVTVADPSIADVGPSQIVFDKDTRKGRKSFTGNKTGATTYTVSFWRLPQGRFEGTGTVTVGKCATFTVNPIVASFNQATFSTAYQLTVTNPQGEPITVTWSGPNCESFSPTGPSTPNSAPAFASVMTWTHPHPTCPAGDHQEVTITATVTGPNGKKICTYQGAETGQGPPCTNAP